MVGISSKALNGIAENKYRYNGNEEQKGEFSDGSGLDVYDFNARTNDAQIGRFIQIDPLSDEGDQEGVSPYQFGLNNPILYNDPDGECPLCVIPIVIGLLLNSQPANPPAAITHQTQEDIDRWKQAEQDQSAGVVTSLIPGGKAAKPSQIIYQKASNEVKRAEKNTRKQ